jgi:hypothetical protein
MLFILFAIILFLIGRLVTAEIYRAYNDHASAGEQIIGRFIAPLQFLGIYVLLLSLVSIIGFYWSRKNIYLSVKKGFLYSIIFCLFLVLVYAGLVVYLFI